MRSAIVKQSAETPIAPSDESRAKRLRHGEIKMRAFLLTTTILCALPSVAFAQETDNAVETASAEEGLGEIVVTAQRKEESSQRAAVPLSVIDGSAMLAAGITQADRLSQIAPALTIQPSSTGNLIFLRGVGNFTLVATSDPAIAFNYDGVYVGLL